jgi:hypothetical protein
MTGTILRPGEGQTPGFWKNHGAIFKQEMGYSVNVRYEVIFGVDVKGSKLFSANPT